MKRKILACAILTNIAASPLAHAQDDGGSLALEELIVTSERRLQSLQDTPLAITAISGNNIEEAQITRTADLASRVPGFQISRGRLGEQKTVVRGIGGSLRDNIAASPKVAFFIDDVYVARGAAMDMAFFDLERVEVLRGPQGTLYGKNAIAGAVNVHSNPPNQDFGGKVSVEVGNYNTLQTRFLVNGPLTESLSAKLILGNNEHDGYTKNLTTGNDLSVEESYFGRAIFLYEGEQWEIQTSIDLEDNPSNPGTALHVVGNFDPLNIGGLAGTIVTSPDDRHEVTLDDDGEGSQSSEGFSIKASYDGEKFSFSSITGYRAVENTFRRDIDNYPSDTPFDLSPIAFFNPVFDGLIAPLEIVNSAEDDTWSASQEFRLSSDHYLDGDLFWTTGLYFFHDEGSREEAFVINVFGGIPQIQTLDLEGDTVALYGQATYTVTPDLDITFGLRYSYESKEAIHSLVDGIVPVFADEPAFTNAKIDQSWTHLTPKLTIDYSLTDEALIYFTYSKGTIGGGFNFGPASELAAKTESFDPEEANNFELGLKASAFNDRLHYSVTAFYIDYTDLQVQGLNANGATTTENAGEATSEGIELEAKMAVTEGLTINIAYAYVDAEFDVYCENGLDTSLKGEACTAPGNASPSINPLAPPTVDLSGNQLEYSSRENFNLGASYDTYLENMGRLTFNLNYSFLTKQYFSPINESGQGYYDLVDASVTFDALDEDWNIVLWGKNLAEEEYNVDFVSYGEIQGNDGGAAYVQGAPRTYGLTLTYTY